MVYIFSNTITNRLEFIVEFICNTGGINYKLINNIEEFNIYTGPKINYSDKNSKEGIQIHPIKLLFEDSITEQEINLEAKDYPYFFQTLGDLNFDMFAASFYLISRYEEYLPHQRDEHDRYLALNSLAYKNNFLHIPVIDIWIEQFKNLLVNKYPGYQFSKKEYKFLSTIDVDVAYYAFYTKGLLRGILSILKNVFTLNLKELKIQWNILLKKIDDPYDAYHQIFEIHKKYKVNAIFFIHAGKYGKYDKNIPLKSKRFKSLLNNLVLQGKIGVHPSYKSNFKPNYIKQEINNLSKIINKEILKSRQHFLMLKFPFTYRNLINAGIKEDYTMGYAEEPGFRAGTCSPFYFFDLKTNKKTNLKVFPFAVMDGTLNGYKSLNHSEAQIVVKDLIKSVKQVNGNFITIWHNSSFNKYNIWRGWEDFYNNLVNDAV